MRLVAFADTHQFHEELVLPPADVAICAGDIGRGGDREEIESFLTWFALQPHRHKILVPGNHDGCLESPASFADLQRRFPAVQIVVDAAVEIEGLRLWGSPWTPRFHSWFFMRARGADLAERWAQIPDDVDVLITHGPPKGILDDVRRSRFRVSDKTPDLADDERFAGCADLRARVRVVRPKVHLFGHIHCQQGVVVDDGVTFINCTTNECELPVMVIDFAGQNVGQSVGQNVGTWGTPTVSLGPPPLPLPLPSLCHLSDV